jgi:hypothetical protein
VECDHFVDCIRQVSRSIKWGAITVSSGLLFSLVTELFDDLQAVGFQKLWPMDSIKKNDCAVLQFNNQPYMVWMNKAVSFPFTDEAITCK